jgi:flagellin-like protein
MKGVSPFVAIVLLIAFTVAVGGMLYAWSTGFFKGTGEQVSSTVEKASQCMQVVMDVNPATGVKYDFSGGPPEELKVFLTNKGKVEIYNLTFIVQTTDGIWELQPTNQRTEANPLKPGESEFFIVKADVDITGDFRNLIIRAMCQGIRIETKVVIS